jgi:glycosyltransferase involved in cell wall biosynthesis
VALPAQPLGGGVDAPDYPRRIAALVAADGISGPGRQLAALARALDGVGVACLIVVIHRRGRPPSAFARYLEGAGVEHCVVEDRGPLDWRVALKLRAVLERWQPSIVQTHGYKATAVAYLLRRLGARWSWIGFFHGSTTEDRKARFYHWVDRRLLGRAERIVVMATAQARDFRHCGRRVRIIYNAALCSIPADDPSERDRIGAVARLLPRPIVGVVGRLSPEKGVDLFLDACAILKRGAVAVSALIAGDGSERGRLEAQCRRLGLESCVRFLGQVHNVDVVYRHLDLLVQPSRSEGLPNTLLEALLADVPVVATAVGAIPEVVGRSPAARLVVPGSSAALAEAMECAVTGGDSPEAAAARQEVARAFSLERRLDAHLQLYREVLEERRRLEH